MKLAKVEYEFFEFEAPSSDAEVLDRQLRLRFEDAPPRYVSWTWRRHSDVGSPAYSVDASEESFFSDEPHVVHDASSAWSSIIGRDVVLLFADDEFQVLEIRAQAASMFCSSRDEDVVRISSTRPR